ncbi:hypothetical protein NC653_010374 [Populus alba x Populus x berolinensis]|uniref:Uncharacterized protein n=1 Tax=Populus alba x Populus x berolinensis TaxID=444605 RepID=A0AAD6R129_9ROSI|nr:hypothetical protein NC653_010374 [Populus alba x Populus x berolinensis]
MELWIDDGNGKVEMDRCRTDDVQSFRDTEITTLK